MTSHRSSSALPFEARRVLWERLWERLLRPVPEDLAAPNQSGHRSEQKGGE